MVKIVLSTKLGELRWTQAELSRRTGIRAATINEYYHELTEHIKLEHLDLMCEALGCDISDLIIRIPNPTPKILSRPSNGKGKVHK